MLAGCVIFICSTGVKRGLESQLEMLLYLLFLSSHSVIRNLGVGTLDTKKGQLQPESSPGWALPEPDGPSMAPLSLKSGLPDSSAFDWHVTFLSSWTEKPSSRWLSTSENVISEYASTGPSSPTSFPASWPSVYFNYTMKTLKNGWLLYHIGP